MSNIIALNAYLKPFQPFFEMKGVTEICINRPYELWIEQNGYFAAHEIPEFSPAFLSQFASLVAEYNQREISPEYPSLSSVLPDGSRVQFVIEPACEKESFICAIRRKSMLQVDLENYFRADGSVHSELDKQQKNNITLHRLYTTGDYVAFLKLAITLKKNIIISGGTSTGKTTVLNALLQHIPLSERIITIETDREVVSDHPNTVHLLAAQEGKSLADITMLGLLKAALRLRPDRLLVSELRAEEAFSYLRAVNSGHPGSITTLHADSPQGCFDQLAFMALQSNTNITRQEILEYAKSVINIIVQIKRDSNGERLINEIYFDEMLKN